MHKACASGKVEFVGSTGHPKLHVALGAGGHIRRAVMSLGRLSQATSYYVSLLNLNCLLWFVAQRTLVGLTWRVFLEEEAMIRRDPDLCRIQLVHAKLNQFHQFVNAIRDSLKSLIFC